MTKKIKYQFICSWVTPNRPVPKKRAKVGKKKDGSSVAYYPEPSRGSKRPSYVTYKNQVAVDCRNAMISGPVYYGGVDSVGRYRLTVTIYTTADGHGDWDNLGGTFSDAIEGIIWANDNQVAEGHVYKILDLDPANSRTEISIDRLVPPY